MGVIHVLDSAVADQIAAGEVVERPSSVVKELLENALDAGARHIEVHVRMGHGGDGVERLTIVDDGRGMAADDAVLCFSRHATSKLRSADDLRRIGTFGFRGEALAAIASVAKVRLLTRPAAASAATEVRVEAGRVSHVGEAGAPVGTRIDVDDLFFNVPARRKFLKSARTEAAHVEDALASAALTLPHVGLRLVVDGKAVLDLPAAAEDAALEHPQRIERAVRCLGKHVRPHLFPIEGRTDLLALRGYVVAPLETRRDLQGVHLSVNTRPVSDRGLVQAVRTAFRTLLEVGRQPIVALDIALDPELVDVNVHPRKAEVRFTDPRRVTGHVIAVLSDFLATTPWLKSATSDTGRTWRPGPGRVLRADGVFTPSMTAPAASPEATAGHAAATDVATEGAHIEELPRSDAPNPVLDAHRDRVREALARYGAARGPALAVGRTPFPSVPSDAALFTPDPQSGRRPLPLVPVAGTGGAASFSMLRVVGQLGGTYLVLEAPEGMVVIDQHAAHERVVFERLRAARQDAEAPAQPLLIPLQIELDALEAAALLEGEVARLLARHGLVVEPFGPRTALVKAIPPGLDGKKAEHIARDALAELAHVAGASRVDEGLRSDALDERLDRVCARLACHAAIRAGDKLAPESVRALLRDLDAIDLGAHCPHGRPVVRTVRFAEMADWFDRG